MENDTLRMPLIGERAPEFTAETTQGTIMFPSDYKGKWVILFSHPSDFTPVCTTEFMMFEKLRSELEKLNCALVGLSVGNVASHIAWLHSIREKIEYRGMRNVQVRFPLVADSTMEIARMYGMVSPSVSSTKAVRAAKFTFADAMPSSWFSLRSTLAAHPAHAIPMTAIVFFSIY